MGYVAVTGGQEAIEASIQLLKDYRSGGEEALSIEVIQQRMRLLIDRIMSEAGLYAPDYAALALKQCEGGLPAAGIPQHLAPELYIPHRIGRADAHPPPDQLRFQRHPGRAGAGPYL